MKSPSLVLPPPPRPPRPLLAMAVGVGAADVPLVRNRHDDLLIGNQFLDAEITDGFGDGRADAGPELVANLVEILAG
ncbi:MAG: hypothetical protein R3E58_17055 [Phycisphaerae bacterium]